jgi:hypothetical protein
MGLPRLRRRPRGPRYASRWGAGLAGFIFGMNRATGFLSETSGGWLTGSAGESGGWFSSS